ncbi:hypothetical protein [Pararhizobium arenae]|uniref:hypothetical protein n=1 Tax=Pararhizobium arenae TaxID=1856850 RepID=UPI00094AE445|nr:hypothetical protein [Pararhizobium arenae]
MFSRIAAAIAATLKKLCSTIPSVIDWCEQVIRWPFSVLFGSGDSPLPSYTPTTSKADILEDLKSARGKVASLENRDAVEAVLRYLRAPPQARKTMDLSAVSKDVRATLLTMDDAEFAALRNGGLAAIRLFCAGKDPGVHGVPSVKRYRLPDAVPGPVPDLVHDNPIVGRVRARLMNDFGQTQGTTMQP